MEVRVTVSLRDQVAEVVLNRPAKRNALDLQMFEALAAAGDRIAADPGIRAAILYGAGPDFCSGIDTSLLSVGQSAFHPDMMEPVGASPANLFQRAAYVWREVPVPVICAIQGVAYGGGLQVALGADIRYASPDARLAIKESDWGLIPDMAITTTLARYLGADRLKELAWTGRIVDAHEAERLGLVTGVRAEPLAAARDLAARLASRSPEALRAAKRLIDESRTLNDRDALRLEANLQRSLLGSFNQVEAANAAAERRQPRFQDPEARIPVT